MTDLTNLTIAEALSGLKNKDFTSVELTQAHIDVMAAHKNLNAYIVETPEIALEQAKASDAKRAAGNVGILEGIPLAIKDLFCTEGVQTTAASHILEGFIPQYESTVTQNLFDNGEKIEDIFNKGGRGASFTYNGKDFTITKKGERYLIESNTDWGFEALSVESAIKQAHAFTNK